MDTKSGPKAGEWDGEGQSNERVLQAGSLKLLYGSGPQGKEIRKSCSRKGLYVIYKHYSTQRRAQGKEGFVIPNYSCLKGIEKHSQPPLQTKKKEPTTSLHHCPLVTTHLSRDYP